METREHIRGYVRAASRNARSLASSKSAPVFNQIGTQPRIAAFSSVELPSGT